MLDAVLHPLQTLQGTDVLLVAERRKKKPKLRREFGDGVVVVDLVGVEIVSALLRLFPS